MTITLNLNEKTNEKIVLDPQSESWLNVIKNNTGRSRPCAVPEKYFNVLQTWGLVDGTFAAAKLSPAGMTWLLSLEQQAKADTKKSKKTHAPARSAGEVH
jgi:hypothetical protein